MVMHSTELPRSYFETLAVFVDAGIGALYPQNSQRAKLAQLWSPFDDPTVPISQHGPPLSEACPTEQYGQLMERYETIRPVLESLNNGQPVKETALKNTRQAGREMHAILKSL